MRAGHLAWHTAAVVVSIGCGGATSSTTIGSKAAAAAGPPTCVNLEHASWWQRELVPSCPPEPLPRIAGICEPGACARPGGIRSGPVDGSESDWRARYSYDDAGHLLATTADGGMAAVCTWRRGLLVMCSTPGFEERAVRDASGALTEIVIDEKHLAVARESGRVVAIGDTMVRYRDDGRIVAVGDRTIDYDATGRIVAASDDDTEQARTYDDRGRLDTITTRLRAPPEPDVGEDDSPRELTETFEYDDQGRLVRVVHERAHESTSSVTYYDYDCP